MSTVVSNRMHLFKNNGRSQMNRDALKKKYAGKLKEKRMAQFDSRRHMEHVVRETVSEEMKSDFGELDEDVLLELYDSIVNSIIQDQYEEICRTEEEQLAADVEEFMNPSAFCPSCLLSPLSVDERSAKCQVLKRATIRRNVNTNVLDNNLAEGKRRVGCQFVHHFDGKSTPPTQTELRRLLSEGFLTHESRKCGGGPQPTKISGKLALRCEDCGFSVIIT